MATITDIKPRQLEDLARCFIVPRYQRATAELIVSHCEDVEQVAIESCEATPDFVNIWITATSKAALERASHFTHGVTLALTLA